MIDEKKLIEDIKSLRVTITGLRAGRSVIAEFIKQYQASVLRIIDEQPKTDWIPCEERLPEESLNSVIGWDVYRDRCVFVQYFGKRWHLGNDDESVKIIAWQPLPQSYKKEGNSHENT